MGYMEKYNEWLTNPFFDEQTKQELLSIQDDENEIEYRFHKDLEFGTAGLRGVMGAGTNRMNIYTVRKATQGLCNYILKQEEYHKDMGICIAYDSRRFSPEFAEQAALVIAANGIKAYVFPELTPTPMLSFTVRRLNCISGIVITASHNPAEYNGYKAYWSDGCQVPYPRDFEIIQEVDAIASFSEIKIADPLQAKQNGLYTFVSDDIVDDYIETVKALSINHDVIADVKATLKIVYTPLNGAGNKPVRRVLNELGFKSIFVVPEQEMPDSNFTTVGYPNPEVADAFSLANNLANEVEADIIIATDPDCDRVGVISKSASGEYINLSGNMAGILLTEYILSEKKKNNTLPSNAAVVSTIVSTNLTAEIAKAYGADYFDVLTGFKYIGGIIRDFEASGSHTYIIGFEESIGYLPGSYARDKDGVAATMLICELAAYYKKRNMTLPDALDEIFAKYGYFSEGVENIVHEGIEGAKRIKKIMSDLREKEPDKINGYTVTNIRDYLSGITRNKLSGTQSQLTLPVSDVLYYELEDDSWFCVRPSGTEPKIKIYFGVKESSKALADDKLQALMKNAMDFILK